jgi:hypothetical protein
MKIGKNPGDSEICRKGKDLTAAVVRGQLST